MSGLRRFPSAFFIVTLALASLYAACGDDDPAGTDDDGTFTGTVRVLDDRFSPSTVTITVGDSVTWRWEGSHVHSVEEGTSLVNPSPMFDSGDKTSGTFGYRFTSVDTVRYFCRPHFNIGMKGTVRVQAP